MLLDTTFLMKQLKSCYRVFVMWNLIKSIPESINLDFAWYVANIMYLQLSSLLEPLLITRI